MQIAAPPSTSTVESVAYGINGDATVHVFGEGPLPQSAPPPMIEPSTGNCWI